MGSISGIFSGLIDAITAGDIDLSGILASLLSASAEQQQGGAGQ